MRAPLEKIEKKNFFHLKKRRRKFFLIRNFQEII